jgi:hypothetical protein
MTDNAPQSRNVSRRGLLAAGIGGTAGLLLVQPSTNAQEPEQLAPYHAVDPARERDLSAAQIEAGLQVVAPAALVSRNNINGTALYYEVSRARTSFTFNDTFYSQLVTWRNNIHDEVPDSWGGFPSRVYSYGVYVNKPGMHGSGRAIDIASVYFTTSGGSLVKRFDCRYDQWRNSSNVAAIRRRYWALSASLHHRFRHVLTYLYNSDHHNHIHVDNEVYGRKENALFNTGSTAQVQHVQACTRYVWGYSTAIDGIWGSQTRTHSTNVLRRYGVSSGTILSSNYNWRAFNHATLRKGSGREAY